jgi:hypothetical protein
MKLYSVLSGLNWGLAVLRFEDVQQWCFPYVHRQSIPHTCHCRPQFFINCAAVSMNTVYSRIRISAQNAYQLLEPEVGTSKRLGGGAKFFVPHSIQYLSISKNFILSSGNSKNLPFLGAITGGTLMFFYPQTLTVSSGGVRTPPTPSKKFCVVSFHIAFSFRQHESSLRRAA